MSTFDCIIRTALGLVTKLSIIASFILRPRSFFSLFGNLTLSRGCRDVPTLLHTPIYRFFFFFSTVIAIYSYGDVALNDERNSTQENRCATLYVLLRHYRDAQSRMERKTLLYNSNDRFRAITLGHFQKVFYCYVFNILILYVHLIKNV